MLPSLVVPFTRQGCCCPLFSCCGIDERSLTLYFLCKAFKFSICMCWVALPFAGLEKLIKGCFPPYIHAQTGWHKTHNPLTICSWKCPRRHLEGGARNLQVKICVSPSRVWGIQFLLCDFTMSTTKAVGLNCKLCQSWKVEEAGDQQLKSWTSCALCWSQMLQGNLPERNKACQYTVFRSDIRHETGLDVNIYACCVLFDGKAVCFGVVRKRAH